MAHAKELARLQRAFELSEYAALTAEIKRERLRAVHQVARRGACCSTSLYWLLSVDGCMVYGMFITISFSCLLAHVQTLI